MSSGSILECFRTKPVGSLPGAVGTDRLLNLKLQPALKVKTSYTCSLGNVLFLTGQWQCWPARIHLCKPSAGGQSPTRPHTLSTELRTVPCSNGKRGCLDQRGEYLMENITLLSPKTGAFLPATLCEAQACPASINAVCNIHQKTEIKTPTPLSVLSSL